MRMRIVLILCSFLLVLSHSVSADEKTIEEKPVTLRLSPTMVIPLYGADEVGAGFSIALANEYGIGNLPIRIGPRVGFTILPVGTGNVPWILGIGGTASWVQPVHPRLNFRTDLGAGYALCYLNGIAGVTLAHEFSWDAGIGLDFLLSPSFDLGLDFKYSGVANGIGGLTIALNTSYYVRGRQVRESRIQSSQRMQARFERDARTPDSTQGLAVEDILLDDIFPVSFWYYDSNPMGVCRVRNQETYDISELRVSVFTPEFMDARKWRSLEGTIPAGGESDLDLYALFSEEVMSDKITEGMNLAVEIAIEYRLSDGWYRNVVTETLRLHNRNAIIWDDDRKAASFVTAKDPVVMHLAKSSTAGVREGLDPIIDGNLMTAMGIYETLKSLGIEYVVDPTTPYNEFSQSELVVDYLQFPRQTLGFSAGDCDDLTVLYCALLEAVGIETAFITVPGHIFPAFAMKGSVAGVMSKTSDRNVFISEDGKVYVPVEMTSRSAGFMEAWALGARQWNESTQKENGSIIRVHDAWTTFGPVALPGTADNILLPDGDILLDHVEAQIRIYIDREMNPLLEAVGQEMARRGRIPRLLNRKGTIYASFGRYDEAEEAFIAALEGEEYLPALMNIGNIQLIGEDWNTALDYYERCEQLQPDHPNVLLALARVHHQMENYGLAERLLGKVEKENPELASRYSYLGDKDGGSSRADEVAQIVEGTIWLNE